MITSYLNTFHDLFSSQYGRKNCNVHGLRYKRNIGRERGQRLARENGSLSDIYDKHLQYILMAEAALETVASSSGIGSSLVNIFPIRKTFVFRSRSFVDCRSFRSQIYANLVSWNWIQEESVEMACTCRENGGEAVC